MRDRVIWLLFFSTRPWLLEIAGRNYTADGAIYLNTDYKIRPGKKHSAAPLPLLEPFSKLAAFKTAVLCSLFRLVRLIQSILIKDNIDMIDISIKTTENPGKN